MRIHRLFLAASIATAAVVAGCSSDGVTNAAGNGTVEMKLTDAPFPFDSVQAVTIFVTRVDVRSASADSATSDHALTADSAAAAGWTTVASPNKTFNVVTLQNGATADLGLASLAAGHYSGIRLVINPAQSSVTLKNGMILTGTSTPNVSFPSGSTSGLKVNVSNGFDIQSGDTTTITIDFNLDGSFVMRGNNIQQLGLLFKPVINATVVIH